LSFEIGEDVEIVPYKKWGTVIDVQEGVHDEGRSCGMCHDRSGKHRLYRVSFGSQTSFFLENELVRW
jgi:hypothetical protein